MNREDWLNSLKSDVPPVESLHPEKQRFLKDYKERGYQIAYGIFGPETKSSDGYIDEIIKNEHGTFYKIYGVKPLFKGTLSADKVRGVQLAKSLLADIPVGFLKVLPISIGVLFGFFFSRKKLFAALYWVSFLIKDRVLQWYDIPLNEYNDFPREILRATEKVIPEAKKDTLEMFVVNMMRFLAFVIQIDPAYRFRFQDALDEFTFRKDFTIFDVLNVLIKRETEFGIARKWRAIKAAMLFAKYFYRDLYKIIDAILKEINLKLTLMDSDDWYYCLRYKSYDFGGLTNEEREAERERIDKEKDHVFLL